MTTLPMFSVIVTDCEPSIDRGLFRRKMTCLAEQTWRDFEVLVYHDGPKQTPYAKETLGIALHASSRFIITDRRANDRVMRLVTGASDKRGVNGSSLQTQAP